MAKKKSPADERTSLYKMLAAIKLGLFPKTYERLQTEITVAFRDDDKERQKKVRQELTWLESNKQRIQQAQRRLLKRAKPLGSTSVRVNTTYFGPSLLTKRHTEIVQMFFENSEVCRANELNIRELIELIKLIREAEKKKSDIESLKG